MKLLNFILLVAVLTVSTFMHAHQRIEAIRYSYEIKIKEAEFNKLLDQRRELEYNVIRLKSPANLELALAKSDIKMVLPERWQVFEAAGLKEEAVRSEMPLFVRNIVGLVSLKSVAHAMPAVTGHTKRPY
ncbi:MAG: hypothetical protein ABH875_02280 [Candidatus Omnitrophota bacterium]